MYLPWQLLRPIFMTFYVYLAAEAEAHVKLVVEVLPEWAQTVHIKKGSFIKINKNIDISEINKKLQLKLKEASKWVMFLAGVYKVARLFIAMMQCWWSYFFY